MVSATPLSASIPVEDNTTATKKTLEVVGNFSISKGADPKLLFPAASTQMKAIEGRFPLRFDLPKHCRHRSGNASFGIDAKMIQGL